MNRRPIVVIVPRAPRRHASPPRAKPPRPATTAEERTILGVVEELGYREAMARLVFSGPYRGIARPPELPSS